MIPFNKPFLSGKELQYIKEAVDSGKISGNGMFTKRCHAFFQKNYGMQKCLLTSSCTDALEMASLILDIRPGDEVILPSYTFVSTANAFALRGAKLVFCDSRVDHPGIDEEKIEDLITKKTKLIVVVHYAGISCDMEKVMAIAAKHHVYVVEDAAQAIDSFFIWSDGRKQALGTIGHLAAFSFHETKNIISGEGGMLVVNDGSFNAKAEIVWEKGTNRTAFFRGEIDKYGWVDLGSSFLPSEITAAFLNAQLENMDLIQAKRKAIWHTYHDAFLKKNDSRFTLPKIHSYATNNAHMYFIVCRSLDIRNQIIETCKALNIHTVFHYQSLHASAYFSGKHDGRKLVNSDTYSDTLLRLPLYFDLTEEEARYVIKNI